jgi:carbon-monoxide dehydrogenase medium subunit
VLLGVKPASFDYVAGNSVEHAVAVLADVDGAQVLAGGQSLVPLMCQRLVRPRLLVDVTTIAGLGDVVAGEGVLRLGSTCRQRVAERHPDVLGAAPAVAEAAALVGNVHVRNRGTIGGSLAHADPAAELPAALLATGASVRVAGRDGERMISLGEFVVGPGRTALHGGEVIVGVDVPLVDGPVGGAFSELAPRVGDLPIAGVGCTVRLGRDGACSDVLLAACGVGPGPVDLSDVVARLRGEHGLTRSLLAAVASGVAAVVEPAGDERASSGQRKEAVQMLALDALARAWRMAVSR